MCMVGHFKFACMLRFLHMKMVYIDISGPMPDSWCTVKNCFDSEKDATVCEATG